MALINNQSPSETERVIKASQLQVRGVLEYSSGYGKLLNKHVVVQGKVWRQSGPADITQAVMDTKQVRLTPDTGCSIRSE